MRRLITGMYEFIGQTLVSGGGRKVALLGLILPPTLLMTTLLGAQITGAAPAAAKMVAPGIEARTRLTEKLDVPRKGKANFAAAKIAVQAELSGWTTINGSREVTVPPQGFYIATLGNGTAVTVINGEEKNSARG